MKMNGWDWSNEYMSRNIKNVSDHTGGYARAMKDSPSNGPEKPAKHLDFWISDLQSYKRINCCCFKLSICGIICYSNALFQVLKRNPRSDSKIVYGTTIVKDLKNSALQVLQTLGKYLKTCTYFLPEECV